MKKEYIYKIHSRNKGDDVQVYTTGDDIDKQLKDRKLDCIEFLDTKNMNIILFKENIFRVFKIDKQEYKS